MERTKLVAARNRRHWTLEDAAEQLGIDDNTLHRWEKGKVTPRAYNIQKLCEVYGMTAGELGLEDEEPSTTAPASEDIKEFIGGDLTMRLLALAFVHHKDFQALQDAITGIIEEDSMSDLIDRRDALRRLAGLPVLTLKLGTDNTTVKRLPSEEVITQCAAGTAACWELSKSTDEEDLRLAFKGASVYAPTLKAIVKDGAEAHRKAAAGLVGQCELLRTMLGWHLQGLKEAAIYIAEAVKYAHEANDAPLVLACLDYQAWVHFYSKEHSQALSAIQRALPLIKASKQPLPSRLLGGVHSTIALMRSKNGKSGTDSLHDANDAFFSSQGEEHRFVYMDYSHADLVLNKGMVQYQQGEAVEALKSLRNLIDPDTLALKLPLPERSRIEGLNYMTLASLKTKDRDMERIVHLWTIAIEGARDLHSEQRFSEALFAYDVMGFVWPSERRIKDLRELTLHW